MGIRKEIWKVIISKKKISFLKSLIEENELNNFDLASCYFLLAENEKRKKNFKEEINLLNNENKFSLQCNEKKTIQYNKYLLNIISKNFKQIEFIKNTNA